MSTLLRIKKSIPKTKLVLANKKVSPKNQTFPSLSWNVRLVMALETTLTIKTNMTGNILYNQHKKTVRLPALALPPSTTLSLSTLEADAINNPVVFNIVLSDVAILLKSWIKLR